MWVYQEKNEAEGKQAVQSPAGQPNKSVEAFFSEEAGRTPALPQPAMRRAAQRPDKAANPSRAGDKPRAAMPSEKRVPETEPAHFSGSASRQRLAGHATQDCLLLAAAYLFGTALSGVMQSFCEAKELDMLTYYLQSWGALFTVRDFRSAAALFGAQYFSAMGAVTLLLLFGLCAFGPLLIFLFTMFYGVGTGIVSLQLFLQHTVSQYAAYLVLWGVPAAAMAVCLCFFGATALQVSVRLQHTAFGRKNSVPVASSARLLLGQYVLISLFLLPVCGVAAALLYMLAGH